MEQVVSGQIRIGDLLGRSFRILLQNIVPFGFIALVIDGLPSLAVLALEAESSGAMGSDFRFDGWQFAGWLVYLVFAQFLSATLIYGAIQDLRGQEVRVGACIGRALTVLGPVLGVAFLAALAMTAGFVLLIIPGIIVAVMLYVAIPVAVIEQPGVIQSLRRSVDLTKNYRWHLFGTLLVLGLLQGGIDAAWSAIPAMGPAIDLPIAILIQAFFSALYAVLTAVAYLSLRYVKEGVDIDQVAAVFD